MKALKSLIFCFIILIGVNSLAVAAPLSQQPLVPVLYVKPRGTGDCSNWSNACGLQTALTIAALASESEQPVNIWVAAGTYKPSTPAGRDATFNLISGVGIYGGFPATGTEWVWTDRNWKMHITTLSGDLRNSTTIDDNSYHVVTADGVDATAILDGFTISDGNANGATEPLYCGGGVYIQSSSPTLTNLSLFNNNAELGGGMYNDSSNPTLTNVTFSQNRSTAHGGGMYNYNSIPTLTNVIFSYNSATDIANGGGMYNRDSSPTLSNVTFSYNNATLHGGGMYNTSSDPTLINVTFSDNSALAFGGAVYNTYSSPILKNVTISTNSVTDPDGGGGGMYNYNSSPKLTNVTFSTNSASYGAGMFNFGSNSTLTNVTFTANKASTVGGAIYGETGTTTLVNSIVWGNTPDQIHHLEDTMTVTFSDIQGGGFVGTGNINEDPHLSSLADNGGFVKTHSLALLSPSIDVANPEPCPSTDARGYPRPIDGNGDGSAICDMGAYESDFSRLYLPLVQK